jgi:hypothetical protein
VACLKEDGREGSLSQKKPGFKYPLLPKDRETADDHIVVTKITDSALTGTNLRLILRSMGIESALAGIAPDRMPHLRDRRSPRKFRNVRAGALLSHYTHGFGTPPAEFHM